MSENKKYSKKVKTLGILLILIAIMIIIFGRKAIILNSMNSKVANYMDKNNFHSTATNYLGNSLSIINTYHKDGKYLVNYKTANINNSNSEMIIYNNGNTSNVYMIIGENKVATLNTTNVPIVSSKITNYLEYDNFSHFLTNLFKTNIVQVNCNGKECYKIDNITLPQALKTYDSNCCIYVDKETGLLVRIEYGTIKDANKATTMVTDYMYEFDNVAEKNLVEPDLSQYIIKNN